MRVQQSGKYARYLNTTVFFGFFQIFKFSIYSYRILEYSLKMRIINKKSGIFKNQNFGERKLSFTVKSVTLSSELSLIFIIIPFSKLKRNADAIDFIITAME